MKRNLILKSIFIAVCLLGLPILMYGRTPIKGNGKVVTKQIPVENFDQLCVSGETANNGWSFFRKKRVPELTYQQSNTDASIEITMDENLFDMLNIRQEDKTLFISFTGNDMAISPTRLSINSSSANLKRVNVDSYMNVTIETPLKTDSLHISMIGVGNTNIKDLTCNYISYHSEGVGNLYLQGEAQSARYYVDGVGNVNAYDCKVDNVWCGLSGVGNIKLYATKKLDAALEGVGSIRYIGNPTVNKSVDGVGRIKQAN